MKAGKLTFCKEKTLKSLLAEGWEATPIWKVKCKKTSGRKTLTTTSQMYLRNTETLGLLINMTNTTWLHTPEWTLHLEFRLWEVALVNDCTRTRWPEISLPFGETVVKLHALHQLYQHATAIQHMEQMCLNQQHTWHCTKAPFFCQTRSLICQDGCISKTALLTSLTDVWQCGPAGQTWPMITATEKSLTLNKQGFDCSTSQKT